MEQDLMAKHAATQEKLDWMWNQLGSMIILRTHAEMKDAQSRAMQA